MKEKIYIHFQIQKDLKDELMSEAKQKGLSLNSYIRMIILERNK